MSKALKIFIPTFIIVMFFNQLGYGSCYKAYCLSAAFPKVTFISLGASAFIYWIIKSEEKSR